MSNAIHPLAPQHLPYFIAGADGADAMFTNVAILLVVVVILIGVFYLHIHSLPERLAHRQNSTQLQLIAVLAVLALFTHNNALWILAILLAVVRPPDIVSPLNSIARSLRNLTGSPEPEHDPVDSSRVNLGTEPNVDVDITERTAPADKKSAAADIGNPDASTSRTRQRDGPEDEEPS
jgi:fumarate reductase subunit D